MTSQLWGSILKESSKKSNIFEAYCVYIGDCNPLRNEIIKLLLGAPAEMEKENISCPFDRSKDIISYNWIDAGDSESLRGLHLWSYSENLIPGTFRSLVRPRTDNDAAVIMIGLDISNPDFLSNLLLWYRKSVTYSKEFLLAFKDDISKDKRLSNARFILREVQHDDSHIFSLISTNCGVPIVVTAFKSDKSPGFPLLQAKRLQGQLRAACLEIGASLVYLSDEPKQHDCTVLRRCIFQAVLHDTTDNSLKDTGDVICVPVGLDSADLISAATGLSKEDISAVRHTFSLGVVEREILDDEKKSSSSLSSYIPIDSRASEDSQQHVAIVIESEEEWLAAVEQALSGDGLITGGGSAAASGGAKPEDVTSFFQQLSSQPATVQRSSATASKPTTRRSGKVPSGASNVGPGKDDVKSFFQDLLGAKK